MKRLDVIRSPEYEMPPESLLPATATTYHRRNSWLVFYTRMREKNRSLYMKNTLGFRRPRTYVAQLRCDNIVLIMLWGVGSNDRELVYDPLKTMHLGREEVFVMICKCIALYCHTDHYLSSCRFMSRY